MLGAPYTVMVKFDAPRTKIGFKSHSVALAVAAAMSSSKQARMAASNGHGIRAFAIATQQPVCRAAMALAMCE